MGIESHHNRVFSVNPSKNDGKISGNPEHIDGKHGKALFFAGQNLQVKRQYIDIKGILPVAEGDITVSMSLKVPPDANGVGGKVNASKMLPFSGVVYHANFNRKYNHLW